MVKHRMYKMSLIAVLLLLSLTVVGVLAGATTLTIWIGYPELTPVYQAVANDFEQAHPGVKVQITSYTLREAEKKIVMALAAGGGPDLFNLSEPSIAKKLSEGGLLTKLPKDAITWVNGAAPKWVATAVGELGFYGLPDLTGAKRLFWNIDMFKAAGLSGPPTNWQEVMADAVKLAKYDKDGRLIRSGISLRLAGGGMGIAQKFEIWLASAGGRVIEKVGNKYKAGYDNQAGFDTLKQHLDILYRYRVDSFNVKHDAEAFALQQTAMFVREAWVVGYMKDHAPNVHYGVAQLPRYTSSGGRGTYDALYVPTTSKHQDLAWEYALMFVQPKYQRLMLRNVGWIPVNQKADYSDIVKEVPQYKAFLTTPAWPDYHELVDYGIAPEAEIFTKLAERLTSAYQNKALVNDPQAIWQFLHDAAAETNELLKEAGLYAGS